MNQPTVSIVVCTRDRAPSLEQALADLVDQQLPIRYAGYEVVVVDDASVDQTSLVVARVDARSPIDVRRVSANGTGVANARNVGVGAARGQWVAFFDDDQRTEPTWLAELLDTAQHTGADLVGGPIEVRLPADVPAGPIVRAIYGEHPPRRRRSSEAELRPAGGNRLIHRSVFERIGLHDESLQMGEDIDLIGRAEAERMVFGWAPRAVVCHVIPEERLVPRTVFDYSERAGIARAKVDFKRAGRWGMVRTASTMLLKAGANALLIPFADRRSQVDALDYRARSRLFRGYLTTAIRAILTGSPGHR